MHGQQAGAIKVATFGGRTWLLPFRASGFWVEDARASSVCDCRSVEIAKALAAFLNAAHPQTPA